MESSRKQSVQTLVKKKMKSKIEACYGAEEFKGRSNWFQRFKERQNIVLSRTKKKSRQMMAGKRSRNSTGI